MDIKQQKKKIFPLSLYVNVHIIALSRNNVLPLQCVSLVWNKPDPYMNKLYRSFWKFMPFGVRGIPQNIYCLYSIVSTEILRNKKVNIPFALQPNFLGFLDTNIFLLKPGFKVSSCYKASGFWAKLTVTHW